MTALDWERRRGPWRGARRGLLLACALAVACGGDDESGTEGTTAGGDQTTEGTTAGGGTETGGATDPGETSDTDDTTDPTTDTDGPGAEPSGNQLNQDELFTCQGEPAMPPADIRLLDRYEWTRNVGSWEATELSRNPLYAIPEHRYSSYGEGESLNPSVLSLYLDVVGSAGTHWATGKYVNGRLRAVWEDPEIQCFVEDAAPAPDCVNYYVRRFLEAGVLYRPASDEQFDQLLLFAQEVLADELDVSERVETIRAIASAAWMSSGGLHRSELGTGMPDEHGRLRLGDWELAQAMTYALSRTPPGALSVFRKFEVGYTKGDVNGDLGGFLAAATDGSIKDPAVVASLVKGAIGGLDEARQDLYLEPKDDRHWDNQGEYWVAKGVRQFFREWLDYGELASKPPKVEVAETSAWSGFEVEVSYQNTISGSNGYENTLVTQLDDMIARIVAGDQDVFAELLTSRMFYTPATAGYQEGESSIWKTTSEMNRVYNVAQITEQTRAARWIELPASERAGVLTHPAWLGAHALAFENDPNLVHRGKWIREELLCQDIPDLPLNVDAKLSEESQDQSARQRVMEQIDADPYCSGCHQYMNPLGYPFEIYNHAGFVRVEDHGAAPDGSSSLTNMPSPELEGPVSSAVDMSERFASSDYAKRCFIRQAFRYFAGREETMADACTMVALEEAYDHSGGSFAELLIALFNSDSFQYRAPD